jgi:hypothetical protein
MKIEELDYEELVKRVKAVKSQEEMQLILRSVQFDILGPNNKGNLIDIYMANRKVTKEVVKMLNSLGCNIKEADYIRII